jgi:GDPmannose 4,6-dehydratase
MSKLTAVVTGAFGQDGAYLVETLLRDGYKVFAVGGMSKQIDNWRFRKLGIADSTNLNQVTLDITDPAATREFIEQIQPSELYNLASHSYVSDSQVFPQQTTMVSAFATVNLLECLNQKSKKTRFFQASSSEMFGDAVESPQNENSVFHPRNIYGSAKVFAHSVTENYRFNTGIFASSAILFNHESPLRGPEFVTRKITSQVARIKLNLEEKIKIGNLSAVRDWGYAPEFVQAIRLIVGHEEPDTFVVSTDKPTSVREFVTFAFSAAGIDIKFEGTGLSEVGFDQKNGRALVSVDPTFYREAETVPLVGDSSKANRVLGWKASTTASGIAQIMVDEDMKYMTKAES